MTKERNEQEGYVRNMGLDLRQAYGTSGNANGRIEYVGYCKPENNDGRADSNAVWQIVKYAYDSNGRQTHRRYADATDAYTKVWNDRTTYDFEDI